MLVPTSLWLLYFLTTDQKSINNVINERCISFILLLTDFPSVCPKYGRSTQSPFRHFSFPSLSLSLSPPILHLRPLSHSPPLEPFEQHWRLPLCSWYCREYFSQFIFLFGLFLPIYFSTQSCLLLTLFNLMFLFFCLIGSTFGATFGSNCSLEHCF